MRSDFGSIRILRLLSPLVYTSLFRPVTRLIVLTKTVEERNKLNYEGKRKSYSR